MKVFMPASFVVLYLGACASFKARQNRDTLSGKELLPNGRTAISAATGVELIGSASHVGFSFEGTECKLFVSLSDWQDRNYLQYEIDGVYQKRLKVSNSNGGPVVLTGTGNGKHTVWIYKATEAHTGPIFIQKIEGNNLRPIKPAPAPLIEFIGNSITCGAAADTSNVPCGKGLYHDQHNAYLAYGPRLARAINANFILSSVSGIGIYRNWNSDGPTMPQVYEKTDFQQTGNRLWNFKAYQPAIVSIALGTNDFSNGDGKKSRLPFDSAPFVSNYVGFVQLVKTKYPSAQIALLGSPMLNGHTRTLLQNCLTTVKTSVDRLYPSGKAVAVYFFKSMQARGCTGHPNVDDHRILAEEAAPFFKQLLQKDVKTQQGVPIDRKATAETKALYKNLHELARNHTLFGHQHATEYGHGWQGDSARSDVKSVTGSHPAVIGVDLNSFTSGNPNFAQQGRDRLKKIVEDTYNRGGVTTVAWHFSNPVSGGGFYWVDTVSKPAVKYIIPGGEANGRYKEILKGISDWAKSLKGADGKAVPVIFRPFHEFDGDWFWWGAAHCTREGFISLWRFTVGYLRDSLQVHNFLYAFSPDNRFSTEAQFLERYPGDEWVDMLGMDNYGDMGRDGKYDVEAAIKKFSIVDAYAKKAGKLAAFTETGLESIPNTTWFTETLLKVMRAGDFRLCYVLVWRNDRQSATHYYAPFPGHASVPDFIKFYNDPYTLFENDLKNIYK